MTQRSSGLTLVELLVGVVLGLAVITAVAALLSSGTAARARAAAGGEVFAEVAEAVDQLVRDVRLAGYDPAGQSNAGIVHAEAAAIELTADLDADGSVDLDSEEHITYRPSTAGGSLQRIVGRQSMPIVSNLAPGGFRLRYFDVAGVEIDPTLPAALAAVRYVTCTLNTQAVRPLPGVRLSGGARMLNP